MAFDEYVKEDTTQRAIDLANALEDGTRLPAKLVELDASAMWAVDQNEMLQEIVAQLRIMNTHLSVLTGEEISEAT